MSQVRALRAAMQVPEVLADHSGLILMPGGGLLLKMRQGDSAERGASSWRVRDATSYAPTLLCIHDCRIAPGVTFRDALLLIGSMFSAIRCLLPARFESHLLEGVHVRDEPPPYLNALCLRRYCVVEADSYGARTTGIERLELSAAGREGRAGITENYAVSGYRLSRLASLPLQLDPELQVYDQRSGDILRLPCACVTLGQIVMAVARDTGLRDDEPRVRRRLR